MDSPRVRAATSSDAAALASLMGDLGYPTEPGRMRRRLDFIAKRSDFATYVAEEGETVVGMVGLAHAPHYERDGGYVRIVALSVAAGARGRGVGAALVQAAVAHARALGAERLIANSGNDRAEAHRFYERHGFEARGKAFYRAIDR